MLDAEAYENGRFERSMGDEPVDDLESARSGGSWPLCVPFDFYSGQPEHIKTGLTSNGRSKLQELTQWTC